jgi:hypothetical protein
MTLAVFYAISGESTDTEIVISQLLKSDFH